MKYTISEYLTIGDTKTDEFKIICNDIKKATEKDIIETLGHNNIIKIMNIEIVRESFEGIIAWVSFYRLHCDEIEYISCSLYNPVNSYIVKYKRQ